MKPLSFAWRTLRREWRYGELATLAVALLLAVAALGAVATLGQRVERGILASATELIGGDLGLSTRAALPPELGAEAARLGLRSSVTADFPSVLFANGKSQLADVRAADAAYPLRGKLLVRDAAGAESDAHSPPAGAVYAEQRLLAALDLKPGDTVAVGNLTLRVAGEIVREPDGGELFALAPRLLISLQDARASGLLGVGSRARNRLMTAGDDVAISTFNTFLKTHKPDGAELITVQQSQQNLRSAFERGEAFLRLAALLAALLSGIAVALAAGRYARRKTDEVALLRCLGATAGEVLAATGFTLVLLALPACLLGALLGLGLQELVFAFAHDLLPGTVAKTPLVPTIAAFAIGLAVLFGFALPPLLRLREVPPVRVFQRAVGARVRRFDALYLLPVVLGGGLIWFESDSLALAGVLSMSLAGVGLFALILGMISIRLLSRVLRRMPGALRFGVANLARRRGLSLLQITALALALTALDLLAVVGPSLLGAWRAELPADTPNYFLINIQPDQSEGVKARLAALHAENVSMMPLAVGKLVAINGKAPRAEDYQDRRAAGWINGETRLSWSAELPPTNRVKAGRWFEANPAEPEVSLDEMWIEMFHLKLGDTLTLRIGERDVVARVTSVRGVRWDSFRVNFFLLLDPVSAQGLAYSDVASFHLGAVSAEALASLTRDHPNLSLIDLNSLLDRVRDIIDRVSRAVTSVLGFSLAAGLLVLLAALAASADERRFETALLRTLGANRGQLTQAVLGEFALLGALAGSIAAFGAGLAGVWLAQRVFRVAYIPPLGALAASAIAAAVLVALAGWLGTRRIAATSPLLVLRRA
ncbi:MAG TPA: FtsX-like permease family protein [Rhodanobacteraceae bacterium]|nr:FtsX-like permease family protein [Rhodanobacteraceae bacterium]